MNLIDCVDLHLLETPTCPQYAADVRRVARRFSEHLGRDATIDDLDDVVVNRWLVSLQTSGLSAWTVKGCRARLLAVWRSTVEAGYSDRPPRRVRIVRPPKPNPVALQRQSMKRLLRACERLPGCFRHTTVRRRDGLRAWLLTQWDTGLRLGDVLALRRADIRQDGTLVVTQHKTGGIVVHRLRRPTLAALDMLGPDLFRVVGRRQWSHWIRMLFRLAGMVGTSKRIRQSSGTAVEAMHPGLGHLHLGNGRDVFTKHYLDAGVLARKKPRPPRIA